MPDPDPIDEIQSVIQHAREEDQSNTQQQLDRISKGLRILEERDDPPKADRIVSIVDQLDRLEDDIDDPEESARLREARDGLRGLLEDPERIGASGDDERSTEG